MDKGEFVNKLIEILLRVREKITDESDVVWTRFDTPEQMRTRIDEHIARLRNGNVELFWELSILFAPTGAFQEHSLSNGWGDEYIKIAEHFDKLVGF